MVTPSDHVGRSDALGIRLMFNIPSLPFRPHRLTRQDDNAIPVG